MSVLSRNLTRAALVTSFVFSPIVFASQSSALWFEHSDIHLPVNTLVAELNNDLRFIILPTSRSSNEASIRVRISLADTTNSDDQEKTKTLRKVTTVARSIAKQAQWHVQTTANQSVFSLDLNSADAQTITAHFAQLKQALMNNSLQPTLLQAQNTTVIVTGGIKTKAVLEVIEQQFNDWEKSHPVTASASYQGQRHLTHSFDTSLVSVQDQSDRFTLTRLTQLQDKQDSKQQRREILLTTIANKVAETRIQRALKQHHFQADVTIENHTLANHALASKIDVSHIRKGDKDKIKQLVNSEIKHVIATGVTQVEYQNVVKHLRQKLEQTTRRYSKHYAAEQADEMVSAINKGVVYTEPSYALELLNFYTAHLHEYDVSQAFQSTWGS